MSYQKTIWVDDSTPALNAANLNKIEEGIDEMSTILQTEMEAAEASIITNASNHAALAADHAALAADHAALAAAINSAVIRRTGTFHGTWNPTLTSTFGIANPTDYWWTIQVNQPSLFHKYNEYSSTFVCDGYLDVDDNTIRFTSTDDGAGISADYLLVGISKALDNYAVVNES